MEINIEFNETEITEQAVKMSQDAARTIVTSKLNSLFKFYGATPGHNNGEGTKAILAIVEKAIASPEFEEKIRTMVFEQMNHSIKTAVHNAVDKAVRKEVHKKADALMNELQLVPQSTICPFCETNCTKRVGGVIENIIQKYNGTIHRTLDRCGSVVTFPWSVVVCNLGDHCADADYKTLVAFINSHKPAGEPEL